MTQKTVKLGKYRHYKKPGNIYEVIGVALHTETREELVIYKALYHSETFSDDQLWVRPKSMFFENVEHNGQIIPRFQFINPEEI